jgi:hypothetical protein
MIKTIYNYKCADYHLVVIDTEPKSNPAKTHFKKSNLIGLQFEVMTGGGET